MKIALAQINPCVGDLASNCQKIIAVAQNAKAESADLVIFPELSLLGYPPKDLLLRRDFLEAQHQFLHKISTEAGVSVLVGAAELRDEHHLPYNAAYLCDASGARAIARKVLLPNYNVFDEKRYFSTPDGQACNVVTIGGKRMLISICEDAWNSINLDGEQRYDFDPIKNAIELLGPVDVIVNISASPFTQKKPAIREKIFTHLASTYETPVLMVGQVGANDQWLFDGHSLVIDQQGQIISRAKTCGEDVVIFDTDAASQLANPAAKSKATLLHDVLVMGIKDYVEKCRLPGVVIGLSGGIDSAVCAALAVRALGPRRVKVIYLPSRFSSPQSYDDAYLLAENLGLRLSCLLIEDTIQGLRDLLADAVAGSKNADIVDQNLQARIRGLLIMALTNANDHVMVTTSNKSELAVGYSTIYGDMCGAFSAIGDLYKTEVYALAQEINRIKNVIPESIISRLPTAELRPEQLDSDTLPDYGELDRILYGFIEQEQSAEQIVAFTGADRALVDKVIGMVNRAEYKRRQGAFALMVSDKVFGDARRLPIAQRAFPIPPRQAE